MLWHHGVEDIAGHHDGTPPAVGLFGIEEVVVQGHLGEFHAGVWVKGLDSGWVWDFIYIGQHDYVVFGFGGDGEFEAISLVMFVMPGVYGASGVIYDVYDFMFPGFESGFIFCIV